MKVNIADLLAPPIKILVAEGKFLELRALTLQEMVNLLINNETLFMTLYSQFQEGGSPEKKIGAMLALAPEFVVQLIAIAADAIGQELSISRLPPTVQLIAIHELWKASVPDPKKAGELLSEVMGQLRKLHAANAPAAPNSNSTTQPSISGTPSLS